MKKILLFVFIFPLLSQAAVNVDACVRRLERETAESEFTVRQESGLDVDPNLTCKLHIEKMESGEIGSVCEALLDFTYSCSPGQGITGSGGACCSSEDN